MADHVAVEEPYSGVLGPDDYTVCAPRNQLYHVCRPYPSREVELGDHVDSMEVERMDQVSNVDNVEPDGLSYAGSEGQKSLVELGHDAWQLAGFEYLFESPLSPWYAKPVHDQ